MSTFQGTVGEIPGICIDEFQGENSKSSAFFLSHCHSDHMAGLSFSFFSKLKKSNRYLYCSHISKSFLKSIYLDSSANIESQVIELAVDEPHIIDYTLSDGNKSSVTVSCVPAGHCPGSVMFLFTLKCARILYTGDFRINVEDFSKLRSLHFNDKTQCIPLTIDKLYLDTTFLNPKFRKFPSRIESSKALCEAVESWLKVHPNNIVHIEISANYGSEFLFMDLAKNLSARIHVKDRVYDVYSKMEFIAGIVTNKPQSTRIHACMNKMHSMQDGAQLKCRPEVSPQHILTIVPSVMRWAGRKTFAVIERDDARRRVYVCYSTHASLLELESFVQYFKPKEIFPCVCNGKDEKKRMEDMLREIGERGQDCHDSPPSKKSKIMISQHKTFTPGAFKSQLLSDEESSDSS